MTMRVRTYDVLRMAVEDGIAAGWRQAHKHNPKPDEQAIRDAIDDAVVGEICTWFNFDERSAPTEESDLRSAGPDATSSPSYETIDVPPSRTSGVTGRIRSPRRRGV